MSLPLNAAVFNADAFSVKDNEFLASDSADDFINLLFFFRPYVKTLSNRFSLFEIRFRDCTSEVTVTGVRGETSWGSKEDRYNGYDLQRGPVFYEAYYTDHWPKVMDQQRLSENIKTEKQYSNRGNIIENTYQTPGNSFHSALHEQNARQNKQHKVIDMAKETEAYNMARQLNEFAESLRQDISLNNYPTTDDSTDYVSTRGEDPEKEVESADKNSRRGNESTSKKENLPDGRFDDYMNLILSAIKKSALEILQDRMKKVTETRDKTDRNMIILRHPRFVESEFSADRHVLEMKDIPENSFDRSLKHPDFGIQESEIGDWTKKLYDLRESDRRSIPQTSFPPMENIFQPRPQIINYVFSPNNMMAKERASLLMQPIGQIPASRLALANDKPEKSNRENLIDISKNGQRSDAMAPEIASIEISEITRHKIRHHHGETPRRNRHRRQIAAGR